MPIIDTHVHLYDTTKLTYDWVRGVGDLDRPHLLAEYASVSESSDIEGIVFVDAGCAFEEAVEEAVWVAGLADGTPPIVGIVAGARVDSIDLGGHLDRLGDIPLVRGVRHLIEPHPEVAGTREFRAGLSLVAARGYTFDICCKSWQLQAVLDLVAASSDCRFVIDHIAKPDIAGEEWEPWASKLSQLSECENVVAVKLSGLFSEGPAKDVDRYLAHAIDAFGPERLMIGSDWPVCDEAGSLAAWVLAVERAISGLTSSEQDEIRQGTARRVYGL